MRFCRADPSTPLINEILNKAMESLIGYLLIKLDTIKAFDCLGWPFLYRLLDKIGFGPYFISMLQATNASATSSILLQGKLTSPFDLARSVRQGCPLSPLLFLAAANALSHMITEGADRDLIRGVHIPEIGDQHTHGQFADDTKVMIEAKRAYVDHVFSVFRTLGEASGLFVKETDIVRAVHLLDQPLPDELVDLPWIWETEGNLSKVLGVFMGIEISADSMQRYLQEALDKRLAMARRKPQTLMLRVQMANQLISNVLWYMLHVWPGDFSFLDSLDKQIREFIWSGQVEAKRPRLNHNLLTGSKDDGGLALISIKDQTIAIAGKKVLWVASDGEHTLQSILRVKLGELSEKRWGTNDYAWLFAPGHTLPKGEPHVSHL